MNIQVLLYRFRWMHAPAAILMMLLQRTPVLRLVTGGTAANVGLQSGELLKSAFALVALGAYNSVAGATVATATPQGTTTVTPTTSTFSNGTAVNTFAASGAANVTFSLTFTQSGANGGKVSKSWKVTGTFPPGLSLTGGVATTGGFYANLAYATLTGTPTTAGSYPLTFTTYDQTGGTGGNSAKLTCTVTITGGATSAPVFTTQPSSQMVAAGSNVTFTTAATGTPAPAFQWYKDNVALSGQTGTTLSLTNVQSANTGSYKVVATNSAAPSGVNSSTATLTLSQTITFGALSGKTYGDAPFTVSATASSGLTPTLSIVSGPATISGNTVTLTGAGTVVVRASQSGNTNYAAATAVDQSFSVAQATQSITFGALSGKTYGDASFTVSATASSGLTPTFSIVSGPATLSGSTVTLTGVGTVVVRASQSGNANYTAATAVDQSFSVAQASQTITFGALSSKAYGDAPFTVSATASSGLTPTFSIVSGPATLSGSTVTLTGVGTVVVRASQSGDANYTAATAVDQSFSVSKAAATVTLGGLSQSYTGAALSATATTTPPGLTVTFTYDGSATEPTNAGSYTVVGTISDSLYQGSATGTLVIGKLSQTISFGALSSKTYGDSPFTVSATASSGLTPTFSIVSGPATISGSTVTLTGGGTVVVRASQAGDANYAAASPVDQSFSVNTAPAFTTQPSSQTVTTGTNVTFTAVASGSPAPTYQWYKDAIALSGKTSASLSLTNVQVGDAGSYTVTATNSVAPSGVSSSAATLTVNPVPTAPVIVTHPAASTTAYVGNTVTLSVVATGYPAPSYQWKHAATILAGQTGPTLTLNPVQVTDAGAYTVVVTNSVVPKGIVSKTATVAVMAPPPPQVSSASYSFGDRVSLSLAGNASYPAGTTFFCSKLPTGLTLNAQTGLITGVVTGKTGVTTVTYGTMVGKIKSPALSFTLTIGAFPSPLTGSFEALLDDGGTPAFPAGKVTLLTTTGGTFTGTLTTGDAKPYSIKGSLELVGDHSSGFTTITVVRTPSNYLLTLSVSGSQLTASLATIAAGTVASGTGARIAGTATAATYTMIIRNPVNLGAAPAYPQGDGYMSAKSTAAGLFTFTGKTADGSKVTATAALGADNQFRIYAKPYTTAGGYLAGTLAFTSRGDRPALGHVTATGGSDLYWNKPAAPTSLNYPGGFGPIGLEALMEPWLATGIGQHLGLPVSRNFSVTITGDHLANTGPGAATTLPSTLNLSTTNALTIVGANPSAWTLKLTTTTGVFTGTCKLTAPARTVTIEGALLQPAPGDTLIGGGYLLVPASDGSKHIFASAAEFSTP